MTGTRAFLENLRIHPPSIITNPQAKQIGVVLDGSLDSVCARVLKGVSQYLASNPVDVVLKLRRQWLPRSLDNDPESRRFALRTGGSPEFLPAAVSRYSRLLANAGSARRP